METLKIWIMFCRALNHFILGVKQVLATLKKPLEIADYMFFTH